MTTIQVPLDKNPEVAALVADLQPGDRICGCFTIKSQDSQTLELRIEEMAKTPDELSKEEATDEDAGEEDAATEKSPEGDQAEAKPPQQPGSMGRKLAAKLNDAGDSGF